MNKLGRGSASELEAAIRQLTNPINGQYPRPWMTSLKNPIEANVFTVGKNQRNGYDVSAVGTHDHFIDTLFNRGSENCRALYNRLTGSPSPTRKNTDGLVRQLSDVGVSKVIETNVICYSTPMSADLRAAHHIGGTERGTEIFKVLIRLVQPSVLIAHGSDTVRKLGKVLNYELPAPPEKPVDPQPIRIGEAFVFVVPSLAPPAFNKWSSWSKGHLAAVSAQVADILSSEKGSS
jgi:hypothetical protein